MSVLNNSFVEECKQWETETKSALLDSCSNNAELSRIDMTSGKSTTAKLEEWNTISCDTNINVVDYMVKPYDILGDLKLVKSELTRVGLYPYNMYFCRLSLPETKVIKTEGKKLWGLLKQKTQYKYLRSKLLNYGLTTCLYRGYCVFEQFRSGNIHCHIIAFIPSHIHVMNFKSELAFLFDINSKKELKNFFHSAPMKNREDLIKVIEYVTDKKQKSYESIDQNIFKPIGIKFNIFERT